MSQQANARSRVPAANAAGGPGPVNASAANHRNRPLCRTSQYRPPGSTKVGLGQGNQPSKVVWELDYGLNDKQFKQLSDRFPGIAFVQTGFDCHDHPIAHTSYRIVWENVMRKLKPGSKVADICGNPDANERFNKSQSSRATPIHIDTFCKVLAAKDSVRAKTRWGPKTTSGNVRWEEITMYDMYRNHEAVERFRHYDTFLMNHVLYYYTKSEVNKLLNMNKDSVLVATIHKLDGQNGTINCGEQKYEKDMVTGRVTQTNIETGEFYEHGDPAPWFKDFCYADASGAFAWTVNKGCDDTYVITATSTEPKLVPQCSWLNGVMHMRVDDEVLEVCSPVAVDPPPAYTVEEVIIKSSDLLPSYEGNKSMSIKITHPELYETLCNFMINKPRNARTLQDLTAKAHREAGNNTLLGNNSRVHIKPKALTEHVFAAWMHGAAAEAALFEGLVKSSFSSSSVNRNLSGKTLGVGQANVLKQGLRAALLTSNIARSKAPVHEVLAQFDELL